MLVFFLTCQNFQKKKDVDAPLMSNDKKKEKRDFPELRKQRNFEENNAMKATETPVSLSNMQIEAEEEICTDALNKACAQYTDFNYFFFSALKM